MQARRGTPTTVPGTVLAGLLLAGVTVALSLLLWQVRPGSDDGTDGDRPDGDRAAVPTAGEPREVVGARTTAPVSRAVEVLHSWDEQRARAWARGDLSALRRLYTAGSGAGEADRDMLKSYLARDLVVADLRTQVLAATLRDRGPDRITLEVTDRLAGGVAVGDAVAVPLPRDRATRHTVELVRRGGAWLVREVR